LTDKLIKKGLENIAVKKSGKDIYIFYENRRYRWEPDAINEIFKETGNSYNDSSRIHVVPLHHHIPFTVISGNIQGLNDITFNTDSVQKLLHRLKTKNRSYGKIDLVFLPGFMVQFGNYDHPVEWQVNLTPILRASLWKGMTLSARATIPLHSELQQYEENKIRLGTVALNQLFRLPKNVFLNLSTGLFTYPNKISSELEYERYGFNSDLRKYFLNSDLCVGGNLGVTGQARLSKGVLDYWPMDRVNYSIYGEYRDPVYNVTTRLTAGKFLYDDFAVRFDLSRQFREVTIGFFALKSDFGYNGGFSFIIPIAPRRQLKPAPVRVGLSNYFKWEYQASSVHPSASIYQTDSDLDDKMRFLNAGYLKNQIGERSQGKGEDK